MNSRNMFDSYSTRLLALDLLCDLTLGTTYFVTKEFSVSENLNSIIHTWKAWKIQILRNNMSFHAFICETRRGIPKKINANISMWHDSVLFLVRHSNPLVKNLRNTIWERQQGALTGSLEFLYHFLFLFLEYYISWVSEIYMSHTIKLYNMQLHVPQRVIK